MRGLLKWLSAPPNLTFAVAICGLVFSMIVRDAALAATFSALITTSGLLSMRQDTKSTPPPAEPPIEPPKGPER